MAKIKPNLAKLISILFVAIISFLVVSYFYQTKTNKVCFGGTCFTVEIAQTDAERQKGLMFRKKLGKNHGMLFVFDQIRTHSFWMKNTLIPLDMIWISEDYQIVDIQTAEPCVTDPCISYTPSISAKYVLELNENTMLQKNIKVGDFAKFFILE